MLRNIRLCEGLCTRSFDHGSDLSENVVSVAKTHFAMYKGPHMHKEVAASTPKISLEMSAVTLVKLVHFHKGICICNLKDGQSDVFEMLLNSFCIFLQCPSLRLS